MSSFTEERKRILLSSVDRTCTGIRCRDCPLRGDMCGSSIDIEEAIRNAPVGVCSKCGR